MYVSALSIIIMFILFSCTERQNKHNVCTISIDVDSIHTVEIESKLVHELDYIDEALLYDIVDVLTYNDTLYIHSRNFLKRFEYSTGRYIGQLAETGNEEDQYSSIGRFWLDNDTFKVYDNNSGCVNFYSPAGRFLGAELPFQHMPKFLGIQLKPNTFFDSPDGDGVYVLNQYIGSISVPTPMYTHYSDVHPSHIVEGRSSNSGAYLFDRGFSDIEHNRLLFWEALRDTLFTIKNERVEPLYAFDFGNYAFPADKQNLSELSDRFDAFMQNEDSAYVSLLRYFQSSGNYIFFSFSDNNGKIGYARIDENNHNSSAITLVDKTNRYKPAGYIKIEGDSAMVALTDVMHPECNPALYKFTLEVFE